MLWMIGRQFGSNLSYKSQRGTKSPSHSQDAIAVLANDILRPSGVHGRGKHEAYSMGTIPPANPLGTLQ